MQNELGLEGGRVADTIEKSLRYLRSTRDLRAEMLTLAAEVAAGSARGCLSVVDPVIASATIRGEWSRLLPVLSEDVRGRMSLHLEPARSMAECHLLADSVPVDRPNYRYEVLRLLLAADLDGSGRQPIQRLMDEIGASQTPIRQALSELRQAGVAQSGGRGVGVVAGDLSTELLARLRALPQVLRFRFERGAQIRTPAALMKRVLPLLQPDAPADWQPLCLSGVSLAQVQVPALDLVGLPRLDLVAYIGRDAKVFEGSILRTLDDGLELEPNVLAPAPVAITLVRAEARRSPGTDLDVTRSASPADVFLSLLDLGLRDVALHYAKAVRPSSSNGGRADS